MQADYTPIVEKVTSALPYFIGILAFMFALQSWNNASAARSVDGAGGGGVDGSQAGTPSFGSRPIARSMQPTSFESS